MKSTSKESQLLLAVKAIQRDPNISARAAAKIYLVSHVTLTRRLKGTMSRRDCTPNSQKLTILEESTIVQHILDLDARAFPPRLCDIEDIADRLLVARDARRVGKR